MLLVDRKASLDRSIHTTGIFVRRTLEDFSLPEDCLGLPCDTSGCIRRPGAGWILPVRTTSFELDGWIFCIKDT